MADLCERNHFRFFLADTHLTNKLFTQNPEIQIKSTDKCATFQNCLPEWPIERPFQPITAHLKLFRINRHQKPIQSGKPADLTVTLTIK